MLVATVSPATITLPDRSSAISRPYSSLSASSAVTCHFTAPLYDPSLAHSMPAPVDMPPVAQPLT